MVANMLRGLEARFPWLSSWLGDRLDIELPAFLVSLTFMVSCSSAWRLPVISVHREVASREFKSEVVDNLVTSESTYQDLDQSAEPLPAEAAAGSFAPTLSPTITSAPSSAGGVPVSAASDGRDPWHRPGAGEARRAAGDRGRRAHGDHAGPDRLHSRAMAPRWSAASRGPSTGSPIEIVRRLEQGRTLVVWAFDASGSLQAERQRLGKHIETVYTHINQLDENHLSSDNGLLTMVVGFGQDRRALLAKPTAERSEIIEAINGVPLDQTGVETTFTTVADIVQQWGHYKDVHNQAYRTMVIVVTDEVGDDEGRLEDAIASAQKAKVPVYVLGSQAIFGRTEGHMDLCRPQDQARLPQPAGAAGT